MSTVFGPLTSAVQSAWMLMEVPESERKVPLPRLVPVGITDAALPASAFPEAAVLAPGTIGIRSWAGSMLASAPGMGVAAAVPVLVEVVAAPVPEGTLTPAGGGVEVRTGWAVSEGIEVEGG